VANRQFVGEEGIGNVRHQVDQLDPAGHVAGSFASAIGDARNRVLLIRKFKQVPETASIFEWVDVLSLRGFR
jgi:hypothetical protein